MGEIFEQNRDKYNMEFWQEENAFPPQAYTYNEQSLPASMTSSFSSNYSGNAGSSPDHFSLLEGMMCKGEEYGYFPPDTVAPTISFETTQTYISSDENCSSGGVSPGSVKIVRGEPMCQQAVHAQPVYEVHVNKQQSIDNWIDEMVVGSDSSSNSPPPPRKRAKVTFSNNSSDTSASSPVSTVTSQSTDPRKERRKETNRKASRNYRKKQESRKSTKEKNLAVEEQAKTELERENYAIKQNLSLMLKLFSTAAAKYQN